MFIKVKSNQEYKAANGIICKGGVDFYINTDHIAHIESWLDKKLYIHLSDGKFYYLDGLNEDKAAVAKILKYIKENK